MGKDTSPSRPIPSPYTHYSHLRNAAPKAVSSRTSLPVDYNPDLPLTDAYASTDPDVEACHLYRDQAHFNFAAQRRLLTFNIQAGEYVPWTCQWLGIDWMIVALNTNQCTPAYCHHIINPSCSPEWCHLFPVKRNFKDPALDVVGYLTPCTHTCIWHPIHPSQDQLGFGGEFPGKNGAQTDTDTDCRVSSPVAPSSSSLNLSNHRVFASSTATFNTDQMVYLQHDLYRACDLDEAVENDHWVSLGPLFTSSHLRRTLETPDYKGTSLFTENEAYERQLTDREIVQSLLDAAESGHYLNNPHSHPAFDLLERGAAPACLHPFMDELSERIAFHRTGHLHGTPVGTALLLFNGTKGISIGEFAELRKRSHKCTSCYCYFSFDGYQRHIGYRGVCKNSLDLETVPDLSTVLAKIKPFSIQPPPAGTTFISHPAATNAVGLAWLTWNSHIGVTHDTWAQLITAWRRCDHCGNVQSFQGHVSHLEEKTDRYWSCRDGGDDDLNIIGRAVLEQLDE
ncbi:hypothetical protein EV359DRAFT_85772 [Lentinula novae-zelandiae]|nr:hypothetical protein EV359DRAFT_85772 [Lentinula novae-zelandiae]